MREIKFRCWDKTLKAFVNAPFKSMDGVLYAPTGGGRGDCILMQFTGLLDKNGKEIYEGDVVKKEYDFYTDPADIGGRQHKVGEARYLMVWVKGGFMGFVDGNEKNPGGLQPHIISQQADRLEVIGNIHESPDLLTNP